MVCNTVYCTGTILQGIVQTAVSCVAYTVAKQRPNYTQFIKVACLSAVCTHNIVARSGSDEGGGVTILVVSM